MLGEPRLIWCSMCGIAFLFECMVKVRCDGNGLSFCGRDGAPPDSQDGVGLRKTPNPGLYRCWLTKCLLDAL